MRGEDEGLAEARPFNAILQGLGNIDTSVLTLPLHRVSSALPLHFS